MTMQIAQTLAPSQLQQFRRDGYLVVRGLFLTEVAELRDTFMAANANGPVEGLSEIRHRGTPGGYDAADPLSFYPRMMNPHRHPERAVGPLTLRTMLDPRLHGILCDLLDDEPLAGQSMFYFKPPGARGQDLHQDNFYLRVKPGTCMAAWLAIDDADEQNGGMVVVPGTGNLEIACPEKAHPDRFFTTEHVAPPPGKREQLVSLTAGDVLFFNGSLIHGSYPNTSADRFRRALIFHYMPLHCAEVHEWYKPLLRFDGSVVEKAAASGGGPCGNTQPMARH
jgi:phytanoyl-CoA hydroxylase